MGSLVTKALHLYPKKYQGKEVLQDHKASKDQLEKQGFQDQRACPGMQVGRKNSADANKHLTCHPDTPMCPLCEQVLWDLLGRKVCLGLAGDQGFQAFVEKWDKWAILVCKAWKVSHKPHLEVVQCSVYGELMGLI